ncbi:hypothetical protein FSP39_004477 [Pinctada imbricata]|uniref:A-kinase anchor protein 9 n=1 Tax=Pinctada imbricata TaxID=66713 RepID=A0AA89CBI3_PINIB|nr:hypothetical protein FSP39_004477 [Pinctada imbricata]
METELLRQRLDNEGQQHLNTVLQQLNDIVQSNIQNQQDKFKDELNLHIQAVRLTLEQIYQSQLELVASELDTKHQENVTQIKEKLTNQHQDEISKLEADWSRRLQEVERDHDEELNDSLLQDSLTNQEEHLQRLHRKLNEEHKELLKKLAAGLPNVPRTPKKKSRSQEIQTESEEGDTETESILSMPVTGEEYQRLEEREKLLTKAEDIHKTLETQREEIAQLRSRMLTEYEQLLVTRADVMSEQTEEVEKLQREMEQLQQKYEDQIKTFQAKIESQAEEAIQSRLNEIHRKEIEDLKVYYESQLAELRTQNNVDDKVTPGGSIQDQEVTSQSDHSSENDDLRKEKEYIKSTTMLTVISDDEDEEECKLSESESRGGGENKPEDVKKLLKEREVRIEELQERINIENQANLSLREQLIQADGKLVEMEKMLRTRQCEIEDLKGKITEKDAVLNMAEAEKREIEEKDSQNAHHLYHKRELEAIKQDLEHEHRVEISTLQSESKIQLEIELKRQAADLTFDHNEEVKKLRVEYDAKIAALRSEAATAKSTQEGDKEDDSKSSGTASTVIDIENQGKGQEVKVTNDEPDNKTADELDDMETETVKPESKAESERRDESPDGDTESRSESIPEGDTEDRSESTQNESKSSEIEVSESESLSQDGTPREATQVKQLFGEIARAKEQTFAKLRDEYEGKIQQLNYELEIRDSELKDLTEDYEEKMENMRVHYEQRIKNLEEDNSEIDVNVIKEKVKVEFVKNYENELARVHTEYEEKMELLRQELKEEFDGEKEEMEKQHKEELTKSEEKYEDLIERIRNGEAPEVAEIVQDKYDTELEMAKTLMQQEFEETLESEQQRIEDIHQQTLDQVIKEHRQEADELKLQHERDVAECRKTLSDEYQAKIQEMEHHYNDEIEKLKLDLQVMVEQKELAQNNPVKDVPVTMETASVVTMGAGDLSQQEGQGVPTGDIEVDSSDLSNSLPGVKGSHAAAIAEIEAEFEKKLNELKEGLEKEYEDKLVRLRAEMSSTQSSEVQASNLDNLESKNDLDVDLDLAHEREINDLSAKHAKDLHNMEVQYENQLVDMKVKYEEELENLQRMVSYLQQTTISQGGELPKLTGLDAGDLEEEDLDRVRPHSSTPRDQMEGEGHVDRVEITERGTPPQKVSPRGEVIPERDVDDPDKKERSVNLINFDASTDDGQPGSMLPPAQKPPAVPRDAGIDLTADEDLIVPLKAKSRETTPRNVSDQSEPSSQIDDDTGSRSSTPTDLLQTKRLADTLQDFQPTSAYESST